MMWAIFAVLASVGLICWLLPSGDDGGWFGGDDDSDGSSVDLSDGDSGDSSSD